MSGGFNLSEWALKRRTLVLYAMLLTALLGLFGYRQLGQSEDPPFTFKVMVVQTFWPGATAEQVQREVTDRIERKLQETPDVDFLQSYSKPGESMIFFNIKDSAPASAVPDTWYQVRKKVGDIAGAAAPGRGRAVLQRRVRRRLHQHLCPGRGRLQRRGTEGLRRYRCARCCCGCRTWPRWITSGNRPR